MPSTFREHINRPILSAIFGSADQTAGFLAQPLEHAGLGDEDGIDRRSEFNGHVCRGAPVSNLKLEGSPCGVLELEPDHLQQGVGDVPVMLVVPGATVRALGILELEEDLKDGLPSRHLA